VNPWFCLSIYLSMNLSIFARSVKRSFKTSLPCPALGHFSRWPRAHMGSSAQMTHAHPSGWRRERYDRPRIPPSGDAHSLADVVRGPWGTSPCSKLFASGEGLQRVEGATSGLGEVIGIIGGRCLEAVGTFPMLPYASVDLPTQPHVPTPFPAQCHSKQPAAVRARHRTAACDDWLNHGPIMHARSERGSLG